MVVSSDLFDKESSVSQSSSHLFRLMILQQLDLTIRSWRELVSGSSVGLSSSQDHKVFYAHARSLVFLLKPVWLRVDKAGFKDVDSFVKDKDVDGLLDSLFCFLDRIELTKFDLKKKYDRTLIPSANKHHGYVN